MGIQNLFTTLAFASGIGYALVAAKLYFIRIARAYPYFTAWLIFETLRSLVANLVIPRRTTLFGNFYVGTQIINFGLMIFILLELYRLVLENRQGIASFGRKVLSWAMAIAVSFSIITLFIGLPENAGLQQTLAAFHTLERVIMTSLFLFLLILTAFLAWFPIQLKRNVIVHFAIFGLYFLVRTSILFARTSTGANVRILNTLIHLSVVISLSCWFLFLSRAGEKETVQVGLDRNLSPEEERRLIAQLDAINETLLKSARK